MLLTESTDISNVLYEGPLEFNESAEHSDEHRSGSRYGKITRLERPTVTIGMPVWWNVAQMFLVEGRPLPPAIEMLLREADFFLVRLACSFRPGRDAQVEWARFSVCLRSRQRGVPDPIAFDLHPLEIYDQVKRSVNMTISPSLKFSEVADVSLGSAVVEIPYKELVPVIIAAGIQESDFSWDMRERKEHPLHGARWFHALVRCGHGTLGIEASFNMVADVKTQQGWILRSTLLAKNTANLSCIICV